MDISDWWAAAGIGVSAGTLVAVGFGAVWLQHYLENLRLKREVFRRVVGNIHSVVYDCRIFGGAHSFSESGMVAVNEIRAAFSEKHVLEAWRNWYRVEEGSSSSVQSLVELIRAMSVACKLKHYREMTDAEIVDTFACSCVRIEFGGDDLGG